MSDAADDREDVVFDPSLIVGTWANATRVHRGRDEITIDFVRRIPNAVDPIRVGRVLMPPVAAAELRDQLDEAWRGYTEWPSADV